MKNLIKKQFNLPTKIEDLTRFVLVGREKLVSVRAEIRAIDKLDLATEVKDQKREEATMLAGALLDAEAKIGELLKVQSNRGGSLNYKSGAPKSLPKGITHKQSSQFQALADHKDIVERVKAEAKENDDLPTRTDVLRIIAQQKNEQEIERIKMGATTDLTGEYDVVVVDPPWEIEKIQRDVAPTQIGLDYPTMSLDEIRSINIPAKDNCHLFLWTTHRYLPESFSVLTAWGFKYVCCFVWHKNGGFQPFGLPQYNCEFVLYARKGCPKFSSTKEFSVCFNAKRTKHSEKPDEFYELLRKVTVGKRVDMFNRRAIKGFDGYGNETKQLR
ncbi:MAG: MT-A70 family methyltransferase [Magnetococcus sp. WYHC-3]